MCDTAYVLLLAQIERRVIAEIGITTAAYQNGAKDLTWPSLPDAQDHFDAALESPPDKPDPKRELLRELGVIQ